MTVPTVVDTSTSVTLSCHFDMENEQLYALKWYKDDHEFFRYMPHQQPHIKTFPVFGINLDLQNSTCSLTHCQLRLTKLLRFQSDGAYRCEVSSEAPTFRLAAGMHNVTVAALPKEKPRIEDAKNVYNEGDTISATCISSPSDPVASITWFINNQQAPAVFIKETTSSNKEGLIFRSVSLRFRLDQNDTRGNSDSIELRCVSTLPGIPLPPQETTHIMSVKSRTPQTVSNQKLHSFNSSTTKPGLCSFMFAFLFVTIRWAILK